MYCQGTPLRNEIEARDPSRIEDATKQAAQALARRFGSGAIEGRTRAFVITAIRQTNLRQISLEFFQPRSSAGANEIKSFSPHKRSDVRP